MHNIVLFAVLLACLPLNSAELELGHGVELLAINGQAPTDDQLLQQGDNQIVVEFGARLKSGSKKESAATSPQIVVLPNLESDSRVRIKLAAKTHKQLEQAILSGADLFDVTINGEWLDVEQVELPAKSGLFPYSDPVGLVNEYNRALGLVYDSGKIRKLMLELEQIEEENKQANLNQSEEALSETEVTLQLKIWYSKATLEERNHFKAWMSAQSSTQ